MRGEQRAPALESIDLPGEVREVAERLIDELGDDLRALLWHGSYARGEARPDSDHDLIIVFKRLDDDLLLRLEEIFRGRSNWSTFVQTDEELRQFPPDGRLQFHYGLVPLYGSVEPPPFSRENLLADLSALARSIRFECRYRLLHREPDYAAMDEHLRGFLRARNLRMLFYAAKWAVLALKSRELLEGHPYPVTRAALRAQLTDPRDIAVLDLVEDWPAARESYAGDIRPIALQLDAFARRLVSQLRPPGETPE